MIARKLDVISIALFVLLVFGIAGCEVGANQGGDSEAFEHGFRVGEGLGKSARSNALPYNPDVNQVYGRPELEKALGYPKIGSPEFADFSRGYETGYNAGYN